jgi:hypothetical protein
MKIIRYFIITAGMLLTMTAVAKIISGFGHAHVLEYPEPISSIPFKYIFWIIGIVELTLALICFFSRRVNVQAGLLAWLATTFAAYRLALLWLNQKPCRCLGSLTDALHISPTIADNVMKSVLAYLLIGSYGILFHQWWKRKAEGRMQNDEVKSESRIDS